MTRLHLTVASLALVCVVSFAAGAFDRVGGLGSGLQAITIGVAISAVMETIELLACYPYTLYQERTGMFTPRLVRRQRLHRCGSHSQRRTHRTLLKRARPTAFLGRVGEPRASSSQAQAYDRSKTGTNQE